VTRSIVSAVLALILSPLSPLAPAAAQDVKRLEPVVVTATKVETPQERLGASVSVITEEELRTYNHTRIEEALRSVPGVEVQRLGTLGKNARIAIRGADPRQVQVLVDGVRVKSLTDGQFDWSDLSIDAIERIEIVRGPQSTLHGADAMGGVINVITKKGAGPPSGSIGVEVGSYDTFRERVSFQAARGPFNLAVSGSKLDTRGQEREHDNDDFDQRAVAGRVGVDLPWNAALTLTGRWTYSKADVPIFGFGDFDRDPDQRQESEFTVLALHYGQQLFPWWTVDARLGRTTTDLFNTNGPLGPGGPFDSTIRTERDEVELLNTWTIASIDTLTLGLEHRYERGELRSTFREDVETQAAFLQNELRIADRLFLGGGVRYEDSDAFGAEWTPRVSAAYLLKATGTKLRGAWAEGFRTPTFNDRFTPAFPDVPCPPFGNPDVKPERSESWEAGADQRLFANRVRFGATYFHNRFRNLIASQDVGGFCFRAVNVGRARTEGVEAAAELEPLDWLLLTVNYTFTDTEDLTTGDELPRFARHRWHAGVTVTPTPGLSLFVQARVVSRHAVRTTEPSLHTPGYYHLDAGGTWRILSRVGMMERLDLSVRVENLTDQDYRETFKYRALGLNALVGLAAHFR
jgi:vitamin B12 transporter